MHLSVISQDQIINWHRYCEERNDNDITNGYSAVAFTHLLKQEQMAVGYLWYCTDCRYIMVTWYKALPT